MATNSESRKRWEDIESAHAKNQTNVKDTEAAEAIEVLIDEADAKERAILSGVGPQTYTPEEAAAGVKPVDAIKHGFRECVACGATWEEEVPPFEALRRLVHAYLVETVELTAQAQADIEEFYTWLDKVG